MTENSLKIAIVNDYEVVVVGLAQMLTPFSGRVDVVELDANEPVKQHVDVALYDTFAQAQDGELDCVGTLSSSRAQRLVVYSWNVDPDVAKQSLAEGASGYLSKRLGAKELVTALERVHAGEQVVDLDSGGDAAGPVLDQDPDTDAPRDWPGRRDGLTERESEVLALIVQGLSNDQVAGRAYLSINTIKSYIRSAYRKMGVESRSQAVLWGIDHGFRPDRVRISNP